MFIVQIGQVWLVLYGVRYCCVKVITIFICWHRTNVNDCVLTWPTLRETPDMLNMTTSELAPLVKDTGWHHLVVLDILELQVGIRFILLWFIALHCTDIIGGAYRSIQRLGYACLCTIESHPSTSVLPERSGMTHSPAPSFLPHHWRPWVSELES